MNLNLINRLVSNYKPAKPSLDGAIEWHHCSVITSNKYTPLKTVVVRNYKSK